MTTQESIEYMENEINCIKIASQGSCDRNCFNCDLVREDKPLIESYKVAIDALKKQEKLKDWIESYKNRDYFMIIKDELIDILEEFVLEE